MARKNSKPARTVRRRARAAATPGAPASERASAPQRPDLEQVRGHIDAVDEQIHGLINERARLAQQVGISKSSDGRTVDFYRPEREAQVLRLARARNAGPLRDAEARSRGHLHANRGAQSFRALGARPAARLDR